MKTFTRVFALLTALFFYTLTALEGYPDIPFRDFFEKDVAICIKGMTLEQKIGQVLMFGFQGTALDGDFAQWISSGSVGNIKIFLRNVTSKPQLTDLIDTIVGLADNGSNGIPPFIATDLEGGVVNHIRFPDISRPPAAGLIGATSYAENNRAVSQLIAYTLFELGINMNFAPCADVLTKPNNVVIGTRSYSSDPYLVSAMVKAFVEEQKKMGILSTMKHFPGHGMTDFDSHLQLNAVDTSKREMEQIHLLPYMYLINNGLLDGCMVSHIIYTEFDPNHPAAFSSRIINGLLRGELAFNGIVITDDLEMKGSQRYAGLIADAFILAFQAGDDLQLISHSKTKQVELLGRIVDFFRDGTLSEAALDEKVCRILQLKKQYLSTFYSLKEHERNCSLLRMNALEESRKIIKEGIVLLSSRISESIPAYFRNLKSRHVKGMVLSPNPEFSTLAEAHLKGWDIENIGYLPDRRSNRKKIEQVRTHFPGHDLIVLGLANVRQIEWAQACVEEGIPFCVLAIDDPFAAYLFKENALFIAASFDPYRPGLDALFDSVFETDEFTGIFPYYF
jgi:beta-N-acetylhexosaminidase